jgi:hypothetical protein
LKALYFGPAIKSNLIDYKELFELPLPRFKKSFTKEDLMKKEIMNYETILKVTQEVVKSKDPEKVTSLIVESVKSALDAKG